MPRRIRSDGTDLDNVRLLLSKAGWAIVQLLRGRRRMAKTEIYKFLDRQTTRKSTIIALNELTRIGVIKPVVMNNSKKQHVYELAYELDPKIERFVQEVEQMAAELRK
jgi:hypothetical protein